MDNDALQCGFCTAGFVVAVRAFLNKNPRASEKDIRAGLNGNICRCGTLPRVREGIHRAAKIAAKGEQA